MAIFFKVVGTRYRRPYSGETMKRIEKCKVPKGFTLIELLVVISIIALLLSIMLPSLNKARDIAKRTVCLSNCRQWAVATATYAMDNKGYFPARFWRFEDGRITRQHNAPYYYYSYQRFDLLSTFVEPYVGDNKNADCPGNPNAVLSWKEQKEPTGINYVSGDYVIYVGYPDNLGAAVAWGPGPAFPVNVTPTRSQAYVPPEKSVNADSRMAVAGCPSINRFSDDMWTYYHPYRYWVSQEPQTVNSAFADGSASAVQAEGLVPYQRYVNHSLAIQYMWPNPRR